ncbi:MAG: hypothetical protein K8W52_04185 [Deltaproteobacteria bacterium]|nr:hypothetical protein [Deltaproteobacteria bacterium]
MAGPIIRFKPFEIIPTRCLRCGRAGANLGRAAYRAHLPATRFWTTSREYRVLRAPRRMCFRCAIWSGRHVWVVALITLFIVSTIWLADLHWSTHATLSLAAFLPLALGIDRILRYRVVKVVAIEPDGTVALRNVHPDTIDELVASGDTVKGVPPPVARVV